MQVGDLEELDIVNGTLRILGSSLNDIGESETVFSVNNLLDSSGSSDMEGAIHFSGR